jgi:ABC-type multidrug transport system ATPase subunit
MFYAPLGALSQFTTWLTSFLTGAKRVMELLDTPVTIKDPETPIEPPESKGAVKFTDVAFGYDRHQLVVKGVSFEIKPGEMIGVVGRSGSGKTTLVNLLCRFYDAAEGTITIDGLDVRDYKLDELRRRVGIVLQESYLFRGTIWDNLCYGRPGVEIKQAIGSAKAASAHDFILRSPLGYETMLGEQGAGLSGGEKQRLSLARAMLYDPRVLVLDEATSSIDTEAERGIQEALEHLAKGRTVIAIAHRLSTLRNSDRILVFDRGKLVEQGPHRELLAQDGIYAKLVRIQTQLTKDSSVDRLTEKAEEIAEGQVSNQATGERSTKKTASTRSKQASNQSVNGSSEASSATALLDSPGDVNASLDGANDALDDLADSGQKPIRAFEVDWLEPGSAQFSRGEYNSIVAETSAGVKRTGVFVICSFPAGLPEKYLSVRYWDESGDEKELGMIENLADWPADAKELIRAAIARRYLFRRIRKIHKIYAEFNHVWFEVETDRGDEKFGMRWSVSQATDFGERGKLIHDVEDNRYVVEDVEALGDKRDAFKRYVYW